MTEVSGKEIAIKELNSLRGRLCTVIESAGLPQTQERALVLMIKSISYQSQAVITEVLKTYEDLLEDDVTFKYSENKLDVH